MFVDSHLGAFAPFDTRTAILYEKSLAQQIIPGVCNGRDKYRQSKGSREMVKGAPAEDWDERSRLLLLEISLAALAEMEARSRAEHLERELEAVRSGLAPSASRSDPTIETVAPTVTDAGTGAGPRRPGAEHLLRELENLKTEQLGLLRSVDGFRARLNARPAPSANP